MTVLENKPSINVSCSKQDIKSHFQCGSSCPQWECEPAIGENRLCTVCVLSCPLNRWLALNNGAACRQEVGPLCPRGVNGGGRGNSWGHEKEGKAQKEGRSCCLCIVTVGDGRLLQLLKQEFVYLTHTYTHTKPLPIHWPPSEFPGLLLV